MDTRKALDSKGMGIMLLLCMVWGLQGVELKATASHIAPLFQIALRSGIAALLIILLMLWRREATSFARTWKAGLLAGLLFGLEFIFVGEGLRFTSASHMMVLLYTAPIFVALGMHWKFPAERLAPLQWIGVLLAFSGIVMTFLGPGANQSTAGSNVLWGDFLGLLAGFFWGATTVVIRSSQLSTASATETLLYQVLVALVLLSLAAYSTGQTAFTPGPILWAGLLFQGVIISFASFLVWFGLLRRYMAAQLGIFSFLTPLFGIIFGVWLLHEPLESNFVAGAVMVLGGILLVSAYRWLAGRRLKYNARS